MGELKVLLVNATFGGASGSGRHVKLLYDHLKNRVEFIVWHIGNIGYIDIPKMKSLTFYLRLKKKKIPEDVDIVHIHNPKFAGMIPSRRRKGYIITVHGGLEEFEYLYRSLGKIFIGYIEKNMKKADVITTVSPYTAKTKGWYYIPNMIALKEIEEIEPSGESHLLFVGRKSKVKGYHLFRAIADQLPELSPIALGIDKVVPWEEVIALMKSAYALVLPSEWEGFPSVILEAWACGCPVVCSDIPPLREISANALCLVPRTKEEFIKAIRRLVQDSVLRERLIKKGLEEVRKYDAKNVVEQYYDLYKKLKMEYASK